MLADERGGDRAGHQHVAVRAPFDLQLAAVHHHGGAPPGQARGDARSPRRRRRRSRRPGSARRRAPTRAAGCGRGPAPARSRYWRARGTAGRVPAADRALRPAGAPRRPRRTSRAGCPCWRRPDRRPGPATRSRCSVSIGRASGMSGQSSRAGPMSTRTRPSGSASAGRLPAMVRITWTRRPVSRVEQIGDAARGIAAGAGLDAVGVADAHEGIGVGAGRRRFDDDELVAAHAGAPVSDRRGARRGVRPSGPARSSNTTKSLPQPCILRKRAMGRVYAPAGQRRKGWSHPCRGALPFIHAAEHIFALPIGSAIKRPGPGISRDEHA